MKFQDYRYGLSLTSQFYYCGLPLRLDSYSRCQFNCLYCFANARGGKRATREFRTINVSSLERRLERLFRTKEPRTAIEEMLLKRVTLHFGGMSDPFPPLERTRKVSLRLLKLLAQYEYPTIISTKSDLVSSDEYLDILNTGKFIVQLSINSLDDELLSRTDAGTPGPSASIESLRKLSKQNIPTACRIQPLLPGRESEALDVIQACSEAGVKHVAVEHLKLPIETGWRGTRELSDSLGFDVSAFFKESHASAIGREWVLPVDERIGRILTFREAAKKLGLTFGAADNDLLHLSDGNCCCSGLDMMDSSLNFFKFNYTEAVRKPDSNGHIGFGSIADGWSPTRSIGQYMNSNSRLSANNKSGVGIREYIAKNWNAKKGNSPLSFHGVSETGSVDSEGFKIYQIDDQIRGLMPGRK